MEAALGLLLFLLFVTATEEDRLAYSKQSVIKVRSKEQCGYSP